MKIRWMLALLTIVLVVGCRNRPRRTVVVRDGPGDVTYVKVNTPPPAAPRVVVVKPARPGANHVWVPGHYKWDNGRYRWVKGHWANPPRRGAVWVPGHFTPGRGWVRGHWR